MSGPRSVLLAAFKACLERIKVVDGYETDAGLVATLEPAPVLAEDGRAFLTIVWERQARASDPALLRSHRLTTVRVIAKLQADSTEAQAWIDAVATDIERAMADQRFRFPVGYQFPQYQSAEPLTGPPASGWVGVIFTFTSHTPIR
ncbi:MAG TPA: hypothetical protein VNV16_14935 [Methylibium sp.]|nr:hypothetical protein [Methylibium sp.]